jgi:hypothetical protein
MKRLFWTCLPLACALALLPAAAAQAAESGNIGMGPRVGLTSNPDQVMVGWHYSTCASNRTWRRASGTMSRSSS